MATFGIAGKIVMSIYLSTGGIVRSNHPKVVVPIIPNEAHLLQFLYPNSRQLSPFVILTLRRHPRAQLWIVCIAPRYQTMPILLFELSQLIHSFIPQLLGACHPWKVQFIQQVDTFVCERGFGLSVEESLSNYPLSQGRGRRYSTMPTDCVEL